VKIGQQIMSQVGEQNLRYLGGETPFTASRQMQTALVSPKLFNFSTASLVVPVHETGQSLSNRR